MRKRKTLIVRVKKAAVMRRVMMTTAWQGVKTPEAAVLYERVAVVEADFSLLENFWREGCADVDKKLQEWLGAKRDTFADDSKAIDDYEAMLHLPNNWDDSQEGTLRQKVEDYLTAKMLSQWMAMTWPEQRDRYVGDAQRAMDDVERILWARKRPWK